MLNWLVSSSQAWPVEGSKELETIGNSLEQITNELDLSILRRVILSAGAKTPDAHSVSYLQSTLAQRIQGLTKNVSNNTLGKIINLLKAINNVLSSR